MTTPDLQSQAAAWAKENLAGPGQAAITLGMRVDEANLIIEYGTRLVSGEMGYEAGYAAGVEAGREEERARVCRWTALGLTYRYKPYHDTACGHSVKRPDGAISNWTHCPYCGGRIEVTE